MLGLREWESGVQLALDSITIGMQQNLFDMNTFRLSIVVSVGKRSIEKILNNEYLK